MLNATILVTKLPPTNSLNCMHMFFVQVTVLINDINDHPPVIQQDDPTRVTVVEHSPIGTLITVISAVDVMDYGVNTHVVYEIISGNGDGKKINY